MTIRIHANQGNRFCRFSLPVAKRGGPLFLCGVVLLLFMMAMVASHASAQSTDPADLICPRFAPGSVMSPSPDLWSANGVLQVTFTFQTTVDKQGLTRYCYIANGTTTLEAPTLHVYPGDHLIIKFQNDLPAATSQAN